MTIQHHQLHIDTPGRGTIDITHSVQAAVRGSCQGNGLCNVYIHHTSASLLISENADPQVHADLEAFMARLVPDGDPIFAHDDEGPDDMPSHVRAALTLTQVAIPVRHGALDLGKWQSLYVWEHRANPHRRIVTITVLS